MPTLNSFLEFARANSGEGAILLAILLAGVMLVASDWRLALGAYAGEKLLAGILLTQLLPVEWALLQWVVGGLVGVMWFLSCRRVDSERQQKLDAPWWRPAWRLNASTLFRFIFVMFLLVIAFALRPAIALPRLPVDLGRLVLILAVAGIVGLGLGDRPLRWGLCLTLWLTAANYVINALQADASIVGMLAVVELLLGFAISYLIVADDAQFWASEDQP